MSKLVILGTTHSGKSCYFYGMLRKMMVGIEGFSIRVEDKDFPKINAAIKNLSDVKLPPAERFPLPSQTRDSYKLDLLYNLGLLENFEWDDYPGENLETSMNEFAASMRDAHCLFLCVDGEGLEKSGEYFDPKDIDDLADDLIDSWGSLTLSHALAAAERVNQSFPAVCVMITKYDKVPEKFRSMNTMMGVIRRCFPILFNSGIEGVNRVVTICPVSLGKDLDQKGARFRPVNVEKPICFATYLIQAQKQKDYQEQFNRMEQDMREWRKWDQRNFIEKILHPKPRRISRTEQATADSLFQNGEQNVRNLRGMIADLPLYMNGKGIEWP